MTNVMMFIADNPFIFLLIVLIIYVIVARNLLIKKTGEIEKVYKPLEEYLNNKLNQIDEIAKKVIMMYPNEEKVTNELKRIINSIEDARKNKNLLIKTCNDINYFVLNTSLLRTDEFENLGILKDMELFNKENTPEEIEKKRNQFNKMIVDYNHDILNPPNSILVALFGLKGQYFIIESNEGKEPDKVVINTVTIEPTVNEVTDGDDDAVKKVCPNCGTEFKNTNICPTCGSVVL